MRRQGAFLSIREYSHLYRPNLDSTPRLSKWRVLALSVASVSEGQLAFRTTHPQ